MSCPMEDNSPITRKKVVDSLLWKALERVLSQGMSLVIQIILARILLPEDFGSLAIIAAVIGYANIFVQAGFGTAVVQKPDLDELDISTLFTTSMLMALLLYIVLYALAPVVSVYYDAPQLEWALRVLALILFFNGINSIQTGILTRKMQFKKLFFRSMIAVPISGIIGILLASKGFGVWALVAQSLSNIAVVVIVMSISADIKLRLGFSLQRAKQLYAFCVKIILSSMIAGLHDTLRTMAIGRRYSKDDLAYYDKAYTYSYYTTQIVNATISGVLLPVFSRKQEDTENLKRLARRSGSMSAFVMFPLLLGAASVSRLAFPLLLTEKWLPSVPYFMVFCLLRLCSCVTSIDRQVFYALGKSGVNLGIEIAAFTCNLIALLSLLQIGTMAIAFGAAIVELFISLLIFFLSSKIYGYCGKERVLDVGRPFLNAAVMAATVYALPYIVSLAALPMLAVQIIAGIVLYLGLALLSRDSNLPLMCGMVADHFIRIIEKTQKQDSSSNDTY